MSTWTEFERVPNPGPFALMPATSTWLNNRYQVTKTELPGGVTWLSLKRLKKEHVHDWRELLRIKNELTHPDREALELYPGMWRVVDTSNQYHLFVLPLGIGLNLGFLFSHVSDEAPDRYVPQQARQRPLPSWLEARDPPGDGGLLATIAQPVDEDGNLSLVVNLAYGPRRGEGDEEGRFRITEEDGRAVVRDDADNGDVFMDEHAPKALVNRLLRHAELCSLQADRLTHEAAEYRQEAAEARAAVARYRGS